MLSPVPHQPAASAPGASQSAAHAVRSTASLRTGRRTPEVKTTLRPRPKATEIAAMEKEDGRRRPDAEQDHRERIALDRREDGQRDPGEDGRDRRVPHRE